MYLHSRAKFSLSVAELVFVAGMNTRLMEFQATVSHATLHIRIYSEVSVKLNITLKRRLRGPWNRGRDTIRTISTFHCIQVRAL